MCSPLAGGGAATRPAALGALWARKLRLVSERRAACDKAAETQPARAEQRGSKGRCLWVPCRGQMELLGVRLAAARSRCV